ncbi:putative bacitracin resistance protein [Bacillus sp. 1NLA3E]|nr:putative bacitracin resistance protein [Bacillus sp. 1NLA3E]
MKLSEVNISWFRTINDLGKQHPLFNPIFEFFAEYTVYILSIVIFYYWFTRGKENRLMI